MAGPKAQIPAPIDRPLSRAYLRQFTGWSTAYPPGLSDPTSVRAMENVMVTREGAMAVRPGLRYLSYLVPPDDPDSSIGTPIDQPIVGTHEAFFLEDGSKAYLFAVREDDLTVGFRVLQFTGLTSIVRQLTDPGIGFDIPQTTAVLNFSAETTYVKYLQIDNKIFALSDAGETMRLFTVGTDKTARKLTTVTRPDWTVEDKLTIMQPEAAWISSGTPTGLRTNLVRNPSFETGVTRWSVLDTTLTKRSQATAAGTPPSGTKSLRLESLPTRTNMCPNPLHQTSDGLETGWSTATNCFSITASAAGLTIMSTPLGFAPQKFYARGPQINGIVPGKKYFTSFDLVDDAGVSSWRVMIRWFTAGGSQIGADVEHSSTNLTHVRKGITADTAPSGAAYARFYYGGTTSEDETGCTVVIKNVLVGLYGESTAFFSGDSGADYYWTGTADASVSVYHPAVLPVLVAEEIPVTAGETYTLSMYHRAGTTVRNVQSRITWTDAPGHAFDNDDGVAVAETNSDWTARSTVTAVAPAGAIGAIITPVYSAAFARGETHDIDGVLFEKAAAGGDYFDGDTVDTATEKYAWSSEAGMSPGDATSTETVYTAGIAIPTPETPTDNTLISDGSPNKNEYNVGMFYTFANEVGETWASQVTVVKVQRPWSAWKWETANGAGEPSGTETADPTLCADQLVAVMPEEVFLQGQLEGAIEWSLYMMTWSDQDVVPVVAVKVDTRTIKSDSPYGATGWGRMTPQLAQLSADTAPVPNKDVRYNYSEPSAGGQGLVASDRMVMVLDPTKAAVIKWSSNLQGDYTNFSASRGGGYKTLTSGNLYVPACVKLWQNPQSVDTLAILCLGTDGRSTSYYMAPAQVASQSEAANIMGFEETTATPGTTSPYGVEVFNNSLYHPLDAEIMKSTASNYNINHMSITDDIANLWRQLQLKERIISSQHDSRLYYIVYNPLGLPLEDGCRGNEIWVFDGAQKAGSWSRFLIQASSLREIEQGGRTYMSVVRPDGLYYLDPNYPIDDRVFNGEMVNRNIEWLFVTNTQGANRAHDAWCHFRQAQITMGNFDGKVRWGIRGRTVDGKDFSVDKVLANKYGEPFEWLPTDQDDFLQVNRTMQQWQLYAGNVYDENGDAEFSRGQVNFVQYRYAPASVNVGYEFGSVETFEYGRSLVTESAQLTSAGVPDPTPYTVRP